MMTTMKQRTRKDNVRIEYTMTDQPEWADWGAYWYTVTLKRKRRQIIVPFGTGETVGDPTAEDVLECLVVDASSADQPFEEWASDYGYDTDSRKAEFTYKQVQAQTAKLRKFLGDDFDAYLYETNG